MNQAMTSVSIRMFWYEVGDPYILGSRTFTLAQVAEFLIISVLFHYQSSTIHIRQQSLHASDENVILVVIAILQFVTGEVLWFSIVIPHIHPCYYCSEDLQLGQFFSNKYDVLLKYTLCKCDLNLYTDIYHDSKINRYRSMHKGFNDNRAIKISFEKNRHILEDTV